MSVTCPTGFNTQQLRDEVSAVYQRVAESPDGDFHFHRGIDYAVSFLDYDRSDLEALPPGTPASFAGVGNPHKIDQIQSGQTVVDIGSGAGMDLLLAAKKVGPSGRAIGVDMTEAMRHKTLTSAEAAGLADIVQVLDGDAESLPLEDAATDVVISNGVLNLATDKRKAFSEIMRILRPGGRLLLADIVVQDELSEGIRSDIDLWTG
jgi:arsenite methyltransferase